MHRKMFLPLFPFSPVTRWPRGGPRVLFLHGVNAVSGFSTGKGGGEPCLQERKRRLDVLIRGGL